MFCTFGYISAFRSAFALRFLYSTISGCFIPSLPNRRCLSLLASLLTARRNGSVFEVYYHTFLLPGTSHSQMAWIGSLQVFSKCSGALAFGPMMDRFGPRVSSQSLQSPISSHEVPQANCLCHGLTADLVCCRCSSGPAPWCWWRPSC